MSIRPVPLTHFQRRGMFYLIEIMLEDFEFDEGVARVVQVFGSEIDW